jgi:hypothetical protein
VPIDTEDFAIEPARLVRRPLTIPRRYVTLGRLETVFAILLTCLVIYFQVRFYLGAGGLWRDETNSINLATVPRIGDIWYHLDGDSFPLLWFYVLRAWAWLGLAETDMGVRSLALLISLTSLVVIWVLSVHLGFKKPLFTLALLGLAPVFIRTTGSNRAYGFGILLILLACFSMWRFINRPDQRSFASAILLALLAVHCVYYNLLLLSGLTIAGIGICLRNNWKRRAMALLTVEAVCALSLAPYILTVQKQHDWSGLVSARIGLLEVWNAFYQAIGTPVELTAWIWTELFALCIVGMALNKFIPVLNRSQRSIPDPQLFMVVSASLSVLFLFPFLWALHYVVRPWYFVGVLPFFGLAIDAASHHLCRMNPKIGFFRLAVVSAAVAIAVIPAASAIQARQSNVDLAATKLIPLATKHDLIIVNPWSYGVTFDRYYRGEAPWVTVPPVRFIKYDFVRVLAESMATDRPLDDLLERIEATCRSRGRIFLVTALEMPGGDPNEAVLPTRKFVGNWQLIRFLNTCTARVRLALNRNAKLATVYSLADGRNVNPEEHVRIEVWLPLELPARLRR